MEQFDLSGRVALITGGNSGIGLGMARGLAKAGADVAIWGTNEAKNDAAAEELRSFGGSVLALRCDVSDEEQVEAAFAETVARLGRVDSCFANAGVGSRAKAFVDTSLEDWRAILSVNLDGTFLTLRAAARQMIAQGDGGRLVVTSSTAVIMGQARGEAYAASKGGHVAMVKALAVEMARYGITANALIPGWIDTPLAAPALNWKKFADNVMPRIPQRRWGRPEDFEGIAVYLASDASAYHTGDAIVIDGAFTIF
ncbi:MAG: SDR family oxidoreductase [Acidimicrobiia bacterium]|nr:SDR family oxidoreductase [Acidimicrobiia bacterium]